MQRYVTAVARLGAGLVASAAPATSASAETSAEKLAKLAQNPAGNRISVPFQNNTNLNVGPLKSNQNILNVQPVIPIEVNVDWTADSFNRWAVPIGGRHLAHRPSREAAREHADRRVLQHRAA